MLNTGSLPRRLAAVFSIMAVALFLGSCELSKNYLDYDRSAEADRQDFRDVMAPAPMPTGVADSASIPDFEPVLSTPDELKLPSPLVTVSVNQTVALRELMYELSKEADVDIELDPSIRGSIIFSAKERPFDEVVNRICDMAGLRYSFKNNVLRVERDRPFVKQYNIDYLNMERTGESKMEITAEVGGESGGGEGGGGGGDNGSEASVEGNFESDLWGELETGLQQIFDASDAQPTLATISDPVAVSVAPMATPVDGMTPGQPGQAATAPPPLPGSAQTGQMPAGAAPTLSVAPAASDPVEANAPATYSLSKQSGVLTVFASERQQKLIQTFLNDFRRRSTTQVLIEAKVLQVDLTDEYAAGINWDTFNLTGVVNISGDFPIPTLTPTKFGSFAATLSPGSDLNVAVDAISRFGTVRALSSPRIMALNNQPALVNVTKNQKYFNVDIEIEPGETDANGGITAPTINADSEEKNVAEGIFLVVVPMANSDTGDIQLSVRPTVTKITDWVSDPGPAISAELNGVTLPDDLIAASRAPQVDIQEMDSLVRLQSGQTLVLGGLMKDTNDVKEEAVPVAGDIPLIGNLFKRKSDRIFKSELVIFLRATIVGGANADDMDRKIYKNFSLDRRPSAM